MYTVVIQLNALVPAHPSFKEAFVRMHHLVAKLILAGTTHHVLQQGCYIATDIPDVFRGFIQIDFEDACALAHLLGLMDSEGDLISGAPSPTNEEVRKAYDVIYPVERSCSA